MKIIKSENPETGKLRYTDEFKTSVSFLHGIMGVPTYAIVNTFGISDNSVINWTKKYPAQFLEKNMSEKTELATKILEQAVGEPSVVVYEDDDYITMFCPKDKKSIKESLKKRGFKVRSLKEVDFPSAAGTFITLNKNSRSYKTFLASAQDKLPSEPAKQKSDEDAAEKETGFDAADEIQEETKLDDKANYEELKSFYHLKEDWPGDSEDYDFSEDINEDCCNNHKSNVITDLREQVKSDSEPCTKIVPEDPGLEKIRKLMILRAFLAANKIKIFKNNIDITSSGFAFMLRKRLLSFRWTSEKIYRALIDAGFDEAEVSLRCVWEQKKYFFSVYIPEYCSAFGRAPKINLPENPFDLL